MAETARESGIEGRIVNVSSGSHRWYSGDPISYLRLLAASQVRYDAGRAYGLSKLAMVMHTKEMARRLEKMGAKVTVNCVNPGIARTRLNRDIEGFVLIGDRLTQAAATTCYVAVHPAMSGVSGKYYADCNMVETSSCEEEAEARLWCESEAMIHAAEERAREETE
ncbi:hypothetical protein HPP92_026184 [Vanilla planifolia]|uniref:Uncharacterized protein n=1 Tax=Vanilla planifolia TaxID=51239 RepID=A0A835PF92_VANPL|nr:hypothetical protein HPP92_026184 [Vanilla planifolia]